MAKKKERKKDPVRIERTKLNKFRRIVRNSLKTSEHMTKVMKIMLEQAGFTKATMTNVMEKYLRSKGISPSDIY